MEQPGCLHAGMDVYKWAFKLTRWCRASWWPTASTWRARSGCSTCRPRRTTCASSGYQPVPIETPEGKAAYLERQRAFAERSNALRRRLLTVLDAALDDAAAAGPDLAVSARRAQRGSTPARTRP